MAHCGDSPFLMSDELSLVRIHPLVLFSILDHYMRRPVDQKRVIGTLLGVRKSEQVVMEKTKSIMGQDPNEFNMNIKTNTNTNANGSLINVKDVEETFIDVLEISSCYAVPHSEMDDKVALGKSHNADMFDLHQKVNPNEEVVGWFATTLPDGTSINKNNCFIHDYYGTLADDPLHLIVDTSLGAGSISVKAFTSKPLIVGGVPLAAEFRPVKVEIISGEAERIGIDAMLKANVGDDSRNDPSKAEYDDQVDDQDDDDDDDDDMDEELLGALVNANPSMASVEQSMESLLAIIDTISSHVDDVVHGRVEADGNIGRQISDIVAAVPRGMPESFIKTFNNNVNDLLSVLYLSNLTKTQLAIAEKLGQVL